MIISNENRKLILYLIIYLISLGLIFSILKIVGVISESPNNVNLLNWDASWYHSIVKEGYIYNETGQNNTGFFPGFPFIWKILNINPLMVSILNFTLFLIGISLLKIKLNAKPLSFFLCLSLPSIFFLYIPYSEALFYFLVSLFIYFWLKKHLFLTLVFAVLLSLVRPAIFFMVPPIILLLLFFKFLGKKQNQVNLTALAGFLIGTFIGFYIIGHFTGDFFSYSKSQVIFWDHTFKLPSLPFTTWRGYRLLWLDFFALLICILSAIVFLRGIYDTLTKKKLELDLVTLFSLGYLSMILVYVTFFHPIEDGRTSILSLNRYVLCSPFVHILILRNYNKVKLNKINLLVFLVSLFLTISLVGFPMVKVVGLNMTNSFIYYLGIILFSILYFSSLISTKINQKLKLIIQVGIIILGVILQIYLFNSFLKGNWIG